jgi:predicted nucleotidyltransferase
MERYRALLRERLGERLVEIRLFGSAARGDMWAAHWPMHSDIDLLVVTRGAISEEMQDELVDETYPLFLECGRQLSPQFRDEAGS